MLKKHSVHEEKIRSIIQTLTEAAEAGDPNAKERLNLIRADPLLQRYLPTTRIRFVMNQKQSQAHAAVPSSFWLAALLPASKSGDIIANMEEMYESTWLPKYGRFKAGWIWRLQTMQFILLRWATPVLVILGLIKAFKLRGGGGH